MTKCVQTLDWYCIIKGDKLNNSCYIYVKEDYYLTPDKLWIPLRWIAPELLEEYRGSLIVTDQTKTSNVWYVLKQPQLSMHFPAKKSELTSQVDYAGH